MKNKDKIELTPLQAFYIVIGFALSVFCWILTAIIAAKILILPDRQLENFIIFICITGFSTSVFWFFVISKLNQTLGTEEEEKHDNSTKEINQ